MQNVMSVTCLDLPYVKFISREMSVLIIQIPCAAWACPLAFVKNTSSGTPFSIGKDFLNVSNSYCCVVVICSWWNCAAVELDFQGESRAPMLMRRIERQKTDVSDTQKVIVNQTQHWVSTLKRFKCWFKNYLIVSKHLSGKENILTWTNNYERENQQLLPLLPHREIRIWIALKFGKEEMFLDLLNHLHLLGKENR